MPRSSDFWSLIIALAALVLSQFPPLYDIFRDPEFRVLASNSVFLSHNLGSLYIQVPLDIQNSGGATGRVHKMLLTLYEVETGETISLKGLNIIRYPTSRNEFQQWYNLREVVLKPDERFLETVVFSRPPTRQDRQRESDIWTKMNDDLKEKTLSTAASSNASATKEEGEKGIYPEPTEVIKLDPEVVREAQSFFSQRFPLKQEGNYEVYLSMYSPENELIAVIGFDMTLFESDMKDLRNVVETEYEHGGGIVLPQEKLGTSGYITPMETSSDEIKKRYLARTAANGK